MNIFYLNENPKLAATELCDQHVLKMAIESAQLLCTAHWETGGEAPYKRSHKNHPSSIWARENKSNYLWLVEHGLGICEEFTRRYGNDHKTRLVLEWCKYNLPDIPSGKFTTPPQCMPEEFKHEDTVVAYRQYYVGDKIPKGLGWNKIGNTPSWAKQ